MKNKLLVALLLLVLTDIVACTGTHTCSVSGLTVGQTYKFGYEDSNGNAIIGEFRAESTTYELTGVDSSINCGSIGIIRVDLPEEPPIA